jgi:nicotinamide-nucleotide amidase
LASSAGIPATLGTLFNELYPRNVRGRGVGFCYNFGRIVSAGFPVLVGHMGESLPLGTALGIAAAIGRTQVYVMPGVPAEMARMLSEEVLPQLRDAVPDRVTQVRTVRTFGVPESIVGETLADLMAPRRHPHVGTAVVGGMIDVHIYASGAPQDVARLLEADAAVVRQRLGEAVYAEGAGALEEAVAALLAARRKTVALAESCTGGLAAAKLVNVPGVSEWLLEAVVAYANESKVRTLGVDACVIRAHGAVSEPVVRAMAEGIRARSGAAIALGLTGIAGPGGGSSEKPVGTVWFAVADAAGTVAVRDLRARNQETIPAGELVEEILALLAPSRST